MWEKITAFFNTDAGEIAAHVIWGLAVLFLFWVHPVLVFPIWMFTRELEQHEWSPFKMGWQSWKECLIPSAAYVPLHLLLFG